MTEIYIHIVARMADYIATHLYTVGSVQHKMLHDHLVRGEFLMRAIR